MRNMFVVAGALLCVVGGTALAHDWSSQSELHACAQKSSGALRLLADGDTCKNSEVAVAWNVQGPAGPQGATGPAVAPGSAGKGSVVWKDSTGTVVPIVD